MALLLLLYCVVLLSVLVINNLSRVVKDPACMYMCVQTSLIKNNIIIHKYFQKESDLSKLPLF